MSFFANWVATTLSRWLVGDATEHDLGFSVMEGAYRLPLSVQRVRRPDLSFVPWHRWPKNKPIPFTGEALDVTPELMVEVVSPTNLVDEILEKVAEYFEAGAVHVWLVYPTRSLIQIFDAPTSSRWLTRNDLLDSLPYLPGFQLALSELFPKQ